MTEPGAPRRRTARQRTRSRPGRAPEAPASQPIDPAPPASSQAPKARAAKAKAQPGKAVRGRTRPADPAERDRGLRELVGSGPSQVGVSRAMRARDLNRPTPEDLAEAEADVAIVRRHWQPKG